MGLATWWVDFKLGRVHRKLKLAHFRQRKLRDDLQALKAKHKAGRLTDDAFARKEEALRAKKTALTERVAALSDEEDALKHERDAAGTPN